MKICLIIGTLFIITMVMAMCKTSSKCSRLEENEMDYDINKELHI